MASDGFSLLCLPTPWLVQFVQAVQPQECKTLLQTCTAMLEMVFRYRHVSVHVNALAQDPDKVLVPPARLLVACKHAQSASLQLDGPPPDAACMVTLAACLRQGSLPAVKHVTMKSPGSLFPELMVLTNCCPSLSSYKAQYLVSGEGHNLVTPTFTPLPQIKELSLCVQYDEDGIPHLARCLEALPCLETLTLDEHTMADDSKVTRCLDNVSTQLKHLAIIADTILPQRLNRFPHLAHLDVHNMRLDDSEVELLLGLPTLRALSCYCFVNLQGNYQERACSLTQLTVGVSQTAAWARLPLSGLEAMHMGSCHGAGIHVSTILDENIQAIATIPRPTWPKAVVDELSIGVWDYEARVYKFALSACVAATLPLLAGCHAYSAVLHVDRLTEQVVHGLQQHLVGTQLCSLFIYCQAVDVSALLQLLPSLPVTVESLQIQQWMRGVYAGAEAPLDAEGYKGIDRRQFHAMCGEATHSMNVTYTFKEGNWGSERKYVWQESNVMVAMVA